MDGYEATRIVYSRLQTLDPENASKVMGFLLIQDHGEKEMIRLAFGPDTLLHTLIVRAYNEFNLSSSTPSSPSPLLHPHPLSRQNSASRLMQSSFSSANFNGLENHNLNSPNSTSAASYASVVATNGNGNGNGFNYHGANHNNSELMDELHLQEQLSFLNDAPKNPDLFYPSPELGTSPSNEGMMFPNWGMNNGQHRRSLSVTDIGLGSDPFGWKPCLYYARGYCKNGTSCRFLHGPPDSPDSAPMVGSPGKLDMMEQCQEFLLRSKSQQHRLNASQLLASSSFPYSPTAASKCMNFMLQQQQNERERAAAAAAAGLMLGGEDMHPFGRSRIDRNDFSSITGAGMVNPGSRQIYLTFPADSTFREEDVSNYFSIYGPVQDVRIPYQQKRMFGFVTFVYPETVKLILNKGNPHFVCEARVLVKPYKEKGKVPDKKHHQQLLDRGEFSPCTTPTGHDHRDPYDLPLSMQLQGSPRLMYNDLLLRRKLEEHELQQAIELQSRKLMGLHLFDGNKLHRRNLSTGAAPIHSPTYPPPFLNQNFMIPTSSPDRGSPEGQEDNGESNVITTSLDNCTVHKSTKPADQENCREENSKPGDNNSHEGVEHYLPDSPFASPTKPSGDPSRSFFTGTSDVEQSINGTSTSSMSLLSSCSTNNDANIGATMLPATSTIDMTSYKSHFLQMPRHSSDNGVVPM